MRFQRTLGWFMLPMLGIGVFYRPQAVQAGKIQPALPNQVNAFDLILAMNMLRVSYGLPALIEDPIVNGAIMMNTRF